MAMTVAQLLVEVGADVGGAMRGLQTVSDRVEGMGAGAKRAAAALAPVGVALGAVGAVGLRAFTGYEDALAELVARTGLYGAELDQVEALALRMGETTQFSATQAVDAMLQLVSSGQTAAEAMQTLPHVLTLAAVSGFDLGTSADALTDILAMFNLKVGDAAELVDVLAAAEGASSATTADLVQALSNVGPVARQYGISVDMAAATLAVLSENGIKGAEAGTALRSMLLNMTRPTDAVSDAWEALGTSFYDAEGKARPLPAILADIKAGLADKTPEEANEILKALAGSYGIVALNALLGNLSIEDMQESMENQTSAADVAAAKTNTLSGAFRRLRNSVEALLIRAMRPFIEKTLRPAVDAIAKIVSKLSVWAAAHPQLMEKIVTLGAIVVGLTTALGGAGVALSAIGALLGMLLTPIGLVAVALTGLALAIQDNLFGLGDAFRNVVSWLKDTADEVKRAFETGGIEDAARTLLARLVLGLGDVVEWTRENITTPVIETIKTMDWGAVGDKMLELLAQLVLGLGDIVAWTRENITTPIIDAIKTTDWSAVGDALLELLAQLVLGLGDVVAWTRENITVPIIEALRTTDWSAVGNKLLELLERFLGVAASGLRSVVGWVYDHIITPVIAALINADWRAVGNKLLALLEAYLGINTSGLRSVGGWVYDHIVTPVIAALTNTDWRAVRNKLSVLLEAFLGVATSGLRSIGGWVYDHIITPIIAALINMDWRAVGNKLLDLLEAFLGIAGAGIESVAGWAYDNIIAPIVDTLASESTYATLFSAAASAGKAIFNAMIEALKDLPGSLVDLINDAIPNQVDLGTVHIPDLGPLGGGYDKSVTIDFPDNPIPAMARGGIVTRPTLALIGERGPEAVVPLSRGSASVGGIVINGPVNVFGVQNPAQLLEQLEREARRRSARLVTQMGRA